MEPKQPTNEHVEIIAKILSLGVLAISLRVVSGQLKEGLMSGQGMNYPLLLFYQGLLTRFQAAVTELLEAITTDWAMAMLGGVVTRESAGVQRDVDDLSELGALMILSPTAERIQ